jgi:type II secretory pathway pseudopilin PulG
MEVMPVDEQDDQPGMECMPVLPEEEPGGEAPRRAGAVRVEKRRRKVSLIGAIVINAVTLITLAIILLAILLPGYRRSFTVARATKGSEEVLILVRTSESMMRENSTDFIKAQDGLRNALQEEMGGSGQVWAYVRDNYPDQDWVKENLPESMQKWLEELYPRPVNSGDTNPGQTIPNGEAQPTKSTGP